MMAGIFLGCLDTASNSLVVWMLGPDRSPPFTQSLHAMVALGFVLGSLIVRPFLPHSEQDTGICDRPGQHNLSLISDNLRHDDNDDDAQLDVLLTKWTEFSSFICKFQLLLQHENCGQRLSSVLPLVSQLV